MQLRSLIIVLVAIWYMRKTSLPQLLKISFSSLFDTHNPNLQLASTNQGAESGIYRAIKVIDILYSISISMPLAIASCKINFQ